MSNTRLHSTVAFFGLALGFTVSMIGFGDYGEMNAMFTFQDFRMFLAFAGGVTLVAAGFVALKVAPSRTKMIHKGTVPGSILFGAGWAISGGCPTIPLVQVAEGYVPALATIAGITVGMLGYRKLNARFLHIDSGSCSV